MQRFPRLLSAFLITVTCLIVETDSRAQAAEPAIRMTDVTAGSGIEFVHSHGGSDMGYIVEGMSTGIATFDYDQDGLMDIYFLNGAPLRGTESDGPLKNALYRNNGDFTFTEVTDAAGVGDTGYGLGVAVADYDGDGDEDIYINNFGPNVLYRNNGDKTFSNVAAEAGVANGERVGAGVGFFDLEADGDLDLYVANYVNFTYENHVPIVIDGKRYQAGPQYYKPVPDSLFRNDGQGKFTDISLESGIASVAGPGMGLVCADLDHDLDTDVYVCNDGEPNFFFVNNGTGQFEEIGLLAGLACDFNGKANSSMGVDLGDYDLDGQFDLFATSYQAEMPVLYRNLGGGLFEDATSAAQVTHDLYPNVNWGTSFVDFDNDGDQDLFIACGHFDRIEEIDDRTSQKTRNYLLRNVGGRFVDITAEAGPGMQVIESSRGVAFEDFDNDGDMDVIVVNSNTAPTLLRNDSAAVGDWIHLELQQSGDNSHAIGAVVTVTHGGSRQIREVISGRGYQSHYGKRLHFGLGATPATNPAAEAKGTRDEQIEVAVRWPDGSEDQVKVPRNQVSTISKNDQRVEIFSSQAE